MSYKKSKRLTLPSGARITVYPINNVDVARHGGLPESTAVEDAANGEPKPKTPASENLSKSDIHRRGVLLMKVALLECTSELEVGTGADVRRYTIVDKRKGREEADEITIGQLSSEDVLMITDEVNTLSGLGKEAADKAATFPQTPEATPETGPASQALSVSPEPVPESNAD